MRTSYFHDPNLNSKFLHLTYRKNFQNLTYSLNSFLNNLYPLNSLEVKNKEAETYLNYTTENYLRYKMERKKKKEEEGKESAAKKGEKEERKKGKEGRKEKGAEVGKEKERSWQSSTGPGSSRLRCRSRLRRCNLLSRASLRCKQRCRVGQHQSQSQSKCQGPAAKQRHQRQNQKPRQSPSMERCGWTLQSSHRNTGRSSLKRRTGGTMKCGDKLNRTGWCALQRCLEQQLEHKQK